MFVFCIAWKNLLLPRQEGHGSFPSTQLTSCLHFLNTFLVLEPFTSCFMKPPCPFSCWKEVAKHKSGK